MQEIILNQEALETSEIATKREQVQDIIEQCERVVCENKKNFADIGALVKVARGLYNDIDDLRKAEKKAPWDYCKWLDKRFKDYLLDPLTKSAEHAKNVAKAWADKEERKRREEAEKIRKAAEEEEMRLAEEAERKRKAAEAEARKAEEDARKAREANDAAAMEAARKRKEQAQAEADAANKQAEDAIERAAEVPEIGDVAVRGARSAYGSTAGMRKTLKYEINDFNMPAAFKAAILADENAMKYMRIAIDKNPAAKRYYEEHIKPRAEVELKTENESIIAGLRVYYDSTFSSR